MDIRIFLLPDIVIGIGPKNPTSIGPQMLTQCTDSWLILINNLLRQNILTATDTFVEY